MCVSCGYLCIHIIICRSHFHTHTHACIFTHFYTHTQTDMAPIVDAIRNSPHRWVRFAIVLGWFYHRVWRHLACGHTSVWMCTHTDPHSFRSPTPTPHHKKNASNTHKQQVLPYDDKNNPKPKPLLDKRIKHTKTNTHKPNHEQPLPPPRARRRGRDHPCGGRRQDCGAARAGVGWLEGAVVFIDVCVGG